MPEISTLTQEMLEVALDRGRALGEELERLSWKRYPPGGAVRLLSLATEANRRIVDDLTTLLRQAPDQSGREVEIALRMKSRLHSFLHSLAQFLDGAQVQEAPVSLIPALRQLLAPHHSSFEFAVRTTRAYNYSVQSIGRAIRHTFAQAKYADLLTSFPDSFFVVDCPISESRNLPLHCIFAHEAGHTIFQSTQLATTLAEQAAIDDQATQTLIGWEVAQTTRPGSEGNGQPNEDPQHRQTEVPEPWQIEIMVRSRLSLILCNWIEELASDAIALCLLGPAYFFAFTHFAGPFGQMDDYFDTHPSDRMRIRFAAETLLGPDGLGFSDVLDDGTRSYIRGWLDYCAPEKANSPVSGYHQVVLPAVEKLLPILKKEAIAVSGRERLDPQDFQQDVQPLCDSLALGIPPNEIRERGEARTVKPPIILNAGWVFLLTRSQDFASLLGSQDSWHIRNRIFGLVAKGLEYNQLQQQGAWDADPRG